ncbi:MAG TPA: MMPL family transporter [Gaiellaceae bacterium]|nr:MMPL family transporter [Gaiellaceae bacterium]
MPERWTRAVLRHRGPILACWLVVVALGIVGALRLTALLSTSFAVPGTDSERARMILADHFDERTDGVFTVVVRSGNRAALRRRLTAASRVVPTGHVGQILSTAGVSWGEIQTTLDLQHAKGFTPAVRRALAGAPRAYVSGPPAIQHDLDPILASDLRRGEAIALPIALVILVAVLGLSLAVVVPFAFAAGTITAALAVVYGLAHVVLMVSYVTNLVALIGVGLAVDYSLLVVFRFREELARAQSTDDAIVRTMATAGRAAIVSGIAVAIGLAVLAAMPVPFIRSLGIGGLLVPLAAIAATATLQPVLLSLLGRRVARRAQTDVERGFWARLARAIMRRPRLVLAASATVLLAAAVPALYLHVTPGSLSALPQSPESVRALALLRSAVGAGAVSPTEIAVDSGRPGGARTAQMQAAVHRLAVELTHDREVFLVVVGHRFPFVDHSGRYARIIATGRHEYGDPAARSAVDRLRGKLIPDAHFPPGTRVDVGGGPAQGVDYLSRSYALFPWLVAAVLVLTYLILLRGFRSLLLPLKAVLLNLLSVASVYGLLVIIFIWGVGADLLGLYRVHAVEGWIPIFLFAMLFGLSMDYEVFLVTRMRESWDHVQDNTRAVAHGLERTGRVVTAAAIIMVAAFSGFVAGHVAGLQEFGAGLAIAVFLDATIVRALLVPSLMAIFGRWNWWLPSRTTRRSA